VTHTEIIHFLAIIVLICATILFLIDVGVELEVRLAVRLKWGLAWVVLRYTGIICSVLLAMDVLF
jgi:hypothetical protein